MRNKLKNYTVSSADWEIDVDELDHKSAAISAMIFAFNKFGKNLLLSTTIMVNTKDDFINNEIIESEFFATHKILNELGLNQMAKTLLQITKQQNEAKHS